MTKKEIICFKEGNITLSELEARILSCDGKRGYHMLGSAERYCSLIHPEFFSTEMCLYCGKKVHYKTFDAYICNYGKVRKN